MAVYDAGQLFYRNYNVRRKLMKISKIIRSVLGSVLVLAIAVVAADAPPLTFKFSKASVPGAKSTSAGGINNAGMSVGSYTDSAGVGHGYILKGTKVTTLDDPNAKAGTTGGSNIQYNGTAVVGAYTNSAGVGVGFLYKGGTYTDIPGPSGNKGTSANAINDKGGIVGNYTDSAGVTHGFLLKGGKYTTLDVPGGLGTVATGINNKGTIVAYYFVNSTGTLGSVMTTNNGKTYKKINVPGAGALGSGPLDINNENDVCYEWFDSAGLFHGALFHAGKYYKFDYPKAYETYGGGLNDKSTVAGGYIPTKGAVFQSFNATFK
jgi:probable HAF family extracellular repeat protein